MSQQQRTRLRRTSFSIAERVVKEPRILVCMKKIGSSIFWGGVSVTTLSMIIENFMYEQSITIGTIIRLGIVFSGLILYCSGHVFEKLWRRL